MEGSHISVIIRTTYDILPTLKNLNQWVGQDPMSFRLQHDLDTFSCVVKLVCLTSATAGGTTRSHGD